MGRWVTAQPGENLCGLAIMGGFVNCTPVRDHAANAALRNRQLQAGDEVYIPDLTERQDSAPTERTHVFVRAGVPVTSIRFVHGAAATTIPDDATLTFLNISNYRTDRAGTDGTNALPGPDAWQFNAAADADPDVFKIEVLDTRAANAQLDVTLQALHPVYDAAGQLTGHDLNWSSAAERDRRKLDLRVHRATPAPDQRFRSAYLRLVTDEADQRARPRQTVLVTDDQPNEERVEILDQVIRATYIVSTCPQAGDARCRVTAELPLAPNKRRIKVCVGVFRRTAGDATGFNGVTEAHIRHRLFRWFRRVYAQAGIAPVLVTPGIRLLDPPSRNLVTISNIHGNRATGRTAAGASPSRISLTVATSRAGVAPKNIVLDIPLAPNPGARQTPKALADQLVALINDADFTAAAFENPPALQRLASRRSADVLVQDAQGGQVTISAVRSTDSVATITLALVNLRRVPLGDPDMMIGTIEDRQIIRNFDTGEDRLNCFVVGAFQRSGLRGRAFVAGTDLHADFRPVAPIPFSCFMATRSDSGAVMDGGNNLPYTFPHEAGHVLLDCFHTETRSELMAGGGTSVSAALRGTKRLCDAPVRIVYGNFHPTQTWAGRTGSFFYSVVTERLDVLCPQLYEPW